MRIFEMFDHLEADDEVESLTEQREGSCFCSEEVSVWVPSRWVGRDTVDCKNSLKGRGQVSCSIAGSATQIQHSLGPLLASLLDGVRICSPMTDQIHREKPTSFVKALACEEQSTHVSSPVCAAKASAVNSRANARPTAARVTIIPKDSVNDAAIRVSSWA